MRQVVYHRMMLWKGDPVLITPEQRATLEPEWAQGDPKDVIEVEDTITTVNNIVGFQSTNETLPERLLPKREDTELAEPQPPDPLTPQFNESAEWVKFKAPRQVLRYWEKRPDYVIIDEWVCYCRPKGWSLEHLKRCTDDEINRIRKEVMAVNEQTEAPQVSDEGAEQVSDDGEQVSDEQPAEAGNGTDPDGTPADSQPE